MVYCFPVARLWPFVPFVKVRLVYYFLVDELWEELPIATTPPLFCRWSTGKCQESPLAFESKDMVHYKVVVNWANKYMHPLHTSNSGMPFSTWGFFLFHFCLSIKMISGNWELSKFLFYTCLYSSLVSLSLE